jgi:uncharacterized membrane-anchored protein
MKRSKRLLLLVMLADTIVFGGWIGQQEQLLKHATEARLPIEGYDPRDLFSGHYLRFRLLAERESEAFIEHEFGLGHAIAENEEVELCLAHDDKDGLEHVSGLRTKELAGCPLFLRGKLMRRTVMLDVDRFYYSESAAKKHEWVRRGDKAHLIARVDANGLAHPVDLVINDEHLNDL